MNVTALLLSVQIALTATAVSAAVGFALSALMVGRRIPGRPFFDAVLTSPLALPPTVLGYALLVMLGRHSAIGTLWERLTGSSLVFTRTGAVLAACVTAIPLIWQTSRAALESVDQKYVDAAKTLGMTSTQILARVQLPLAVRGIVAGLVLAFARALGDFGVTLMVAGNIPGQTQTASLAIYDALLSGNDGEAFQLSIALTVIAIILMTVATSLSSRNHAR